MRTRRRVAGNAGHEHRCSFMFSVSSCCCNITSRPAKTLTCNFRLSVGLKGISNVGTRLSKTKFDFLVSRMELVAALQCQLLAIMRCCVFLLNLQAHHMMCRTPKTCEEQRLTSLATLNNITNRSVYCQSAYSAGSTM